MEHEEGAISVSDLFLKYYINVYNDNPLLNAYANKWKEEGYSEGEILAYSQMYQMLKVFQDIDWFDPKKSFIKNKLRGKDK